MNEKINIIKKKKQKAKDNKELAEQKQTDFLESFKAEIGKLAQSIEQIQTPEEITQVLEEFKKSTETLSGYQEKLIDKVVSEISKIKITTPSVSVDTRELAKSIDQLKDLFARKTIITEPEVIPLKNFKAVEVLKENLQRKEAFVFNSGNNPLYFGFTKSLTKSNSAGVIPPNKTFIEDIHTGSIYVWSEAQFAKVTVYEVTSE